MIPHRISLEGFLCYGTRQEIDLSGLGLCMLSGPNGAGKSSVFDAVTFALFGAHRGGRSGHDDLIHTAGDRASVDFEFQLDGHLYKVRRSVGRPRRGGGAGGGGHAKSNGKPAARSPGHDVQLWRHRPADDGWEVVPETEGPRAFGAWVALNVGLTYETFSCSMLLGQGQADRLLTIDPAERFKVLAGVVGLDRYERLEEQAKDRAKRAKLRAEVLQGQLDAVAAVSEEERSEAKVAAETAAAAARQASEDAQKWGVLLPQAKQWADLQARLLAAAASRARHAAVLGRAAVIEADAARLTDVRCALPSLKRLHQRRVALAETQGRAAALAGELAAHREKNRLADESAAALSEQVTAAAKEVETASARERELTARHAQLKQTLELIAPWEKVRRDLEEARGRAAGLGTDPAGAVVEAKLAEQELQRLHAALPALRRFAGSRKALVEAIGAEARLAAVHREALADAAAADAGRAEAAGGFTAAEAALRASRDKAAAARERASAHERALEAVRRADGQADCPTCGQVLTAEHRREEESRRAQRLEDSRSRLQECEQQLAAADADAAVRREALASAEAHARRASDAARDASHALRQAGRDRARHADDCARAFAELSDEMRARVLPLSGRAGETAHAQLHSADASDVVPGSEYRPGSAGSRAGTFGETEIQQPGSGGAAPASPDGPWPATTWPSPSEMSELESGAKALPEARRYLDRADSVHAKWKDLTARAEALAAHLGSRPADLPSDPAPVAAELSRVADERARAADALRTHKADHTRLLDARQRAAGDHAKLSAATSDLERQAGEARVRQEHASREAAESAGLLPPGSAAAADLTPVELPAHLNDLEREADLLERAGAEEDLRSLANARAESARLEARVAEWRADAETLPAAARRDPTALEAELKSAGTRLQHLESERRGAERRRDEVETRRSTRADLLRQHQTADQEHNRSATLARLLGRSGLQTHLIRRAERAIVQHANQTLDKLSGGDLMLQLRNAAGSTPFADANGTAAAPTPGTPAPLDGALDLEVVPRRVGAARPVAVPMLSGSQKFRVAVSLALAIGQYAGGRHRCGESCLIDEGFASLDKEGQEVMIRELQNLRGLLKRIVVVSHLESFAGAFREGYRFRLENGETRVERVGG